MATWSSLMTYIRSNYKISEEGEGYCRLVFRVGRERAQSVVLAHLTLEDGMGDWVEIQSPVGPAADLPLLNVLQDAGGLNVGGLTVVANVVVLKHSVPLAHMDVNEFEYPMRLVRSSADHLERKYLGGDRF